MSDNPGFRRALGASQRCTSAAWRDCSIFFAGICGRPIAEGIPTRRRVSARPQWRLKRRGFGWLRPRSVSEAQLGSRAPEQLVAYVNLARLAVEAAALDLMQLVQRSVGLQAFLRPNPIERISAISQPIFVSRPRPCAYRRRGLDSLPACRGSGSVAMTADELLNAAHAPVSPGL